MKYESHPNIPQRCPLLFPFKLQSDKLQTNPAVLFRSTKFCMVNRCNHVCTNVIAYVVLFYFQTQLISETHSSEHISHARVQGFHGNLAIAIQETGQMANEQPPYYVQNLNANPQFEEDFGGGIIVVLEFGAGQLKLMIINSIPAIVEEL